MSTQLAFDFDVLDRTDYAGRAPLTFTTNYFTPDELLEAHEEAARRRGGPPMRAWPFRIYTWRLGITTGRCNVLTAGHTCVLLDVDMRCICRLDYLVSDWEKTDGCRCVGTFVYQANCPDCRWHTLAESESEVVAAWHDHAWPGWRELPVVPFEHSQALMESKRARKAREVFIAEHYPAEWQVPGAPLLTKRQELGTRHVPSGSPWGGFDLSSTAIGDAPLPRAAEVAVAS